MSQTFRFGLYTARQLTEQRTLTDLWSLLDQPFIGPQRFDAVERAKRPFSPDAIDDAGKIYEQQGLLFVKGSKNGFLGVFTEQAGGWATWDFWLDANAVEGAGAGKWLSWLFALCRELPVLYGFGTSTEEYDAKHTQVEALPSGGSVTSTLGVATREFYHYLPGMYWLTIFGADLVQHFGAERLMSLPNTEATKISTDQIALQITAPAVPNDMQERLKIEHQLTDMLGAEYFFDRSRANAMYQPVPTLAATLQRLQSG